MEVAVAPTTYTIYYTAASANAATERKIRTETKRITKFYS
jgi:hypothetical protein